MSFLVARSVSACVGLFVAAGIVSFVDELMDKVYVVAISLLVLLLESSIVF